MKDIKMVEAVGFDKHFHTSSWQEGNRLFFNQLARKYDVLNEIISLGQQGFYKRSAVEDLNLKPGDRALDLCTGTGDMAFFMASQNHTITVDAVDVSETMLDIAREKEARFGLNNIHFQIADALILPFENNTFDVVMMAFGLRNFADISKGLEEIYRVLKPGGRFITLDLGKPRGLGKGLYHIYYERLMPWLGKVVFHRNEYNSYHYLSTSNKYFPPPEDIILMMRHVGFKDVYGKEYMLGGVAQQVGLK